MRDTCTSHFEPLKFDRVGRRGQEQPKLGIFEGTKYSDFWLFLATPADPVEFLGGLLLTCWTVSIDAHIDHLIDMMLDNELYNW